MVVKPNMLTSNITQLVLR